MNQALLLQLDDPDPKIRRAVTKELRTVIDPSVKKALLSKLSDTDEFVRRNALIGLGNWDEPEIVGIILPLLRDTGFEVRCAAIEVLSKFSCQIENIIEVLRLYYWKISNEGYGISKHGEKSREYDILRRSLYRIDPNFDTWLKDKYASRSEETYLNKVEATKRRIDDTEVLEKNAIDSLLDPEKSVTARRNAAKDLGSVYFDRYILCYIFANANELRYLPGRSLHGTVGIGVDFDFKSWISVANVFGLRFKAEGGNHILEPLMHSAIYDEDDTVRYECVHVLRALKDIHSISELRNVAKRYGRTIDDEGEEAREAISEIEAAQVTITLPYLTSDLFEKLALELRKNR